MLYLFRIQYLLTFDCIEVRLGYETSRCEEDEFENEEDYNDARRKVTLDPSLVKTMLNFSDDESEEESSSVG